MPATGIPGSPGHLRDFDFERSTPAIDFEPRRRLDDRPKSNLGRHAHLAAGRLEQGQSRPNHHRGSAAGNSDRGAFEIPGRRHPRRNLAQELKMARWHSCNILQSAGDIRNLWQFSAGGKISLQREVAALPTEPLPAKIVAKDWQTLFQPKLNVAWLPADKVFFRVGQIPTTKQAER